MGGDAESPLLKPHQRSISSSSHNLRRSGGGSGAHFPVDSVVEVRTDEEDFEGVYFSATVISPPDAISPRKGTRKKSKQLYVEYHNLLAHEDGSDRLRELVDVSFVRPAPPLQEIVKGFEPDDVVDAFYKDGWWTGVVSRVVEGGERFVVTFQNPPDELEFGLADLRAHWDWVNGSWVRPQKQSIAGLMFDVGRKVEVSFDREDSQDAWFPSTIHEDLGHGVFLVEHTDNNGQAIKAKVDSLHLRPCPPLLKDKNFVLLEKVDAFFDFGWWSGVITKELENFRYIVFFKQMKRDKDFNQSELRPHMEWKDGKWFTSSQLSQEASIQSSDDGVHEHITPENSIAYAATDPVKNSVGGNDTCDGKTPSSLTSTMGHFDQLTPDNQKMSHVTTSVTKRRQYLSDLGTALSQPLKKLKEGNVVGANQQHRQDKPAEEVLCGFVSPDSVNNIETSATQSTGDESSLNDSWQKNVQRKQRNFRVKQNVRGKVKSISSSMKKSSTQLLPHESLELDVGGKEPDAAGNTEEDARNEHAKEGSEFPVIICLPCSETGKSEFGISGGKRGRRSNSKEIVTIVNDQEQQLNSSSIQKIKRGHHPNSKEIATIVNDSKDIATIVNDQGQQLNNPSIQKIKDSTPSEIGKSNEKRKRGRPRKILVESTQTPVSGNAQNGGIGSDDLNRKDDGLQRSPQVEVVGTETSMPDQEEIAVNKEKLANDQPDPQNRKVRMTKRTTSSVHKETGVKEYVGLGQTHSSKRGRKRKGEKIGVQVQDSLGASGGKMMDVDRTVEVEKVGEVPSIEFDNEPLSKWIEEMNSPSVIDRSRPSPEGILEQHMSNGEKQRDGVVLDEGSEEQPESGKQASTSVDKGSIVPSELQTLPTVENTVGVALDKDSEKQPEIGTQASALVDKCCTVQSEPQSLPFVKNTSLWKTIESMEVFQKIPQKPHFQPLEQFKESSREGLAIGYMVTFASLVEKTSRLQLNDPKSILDDIMETLVDLERHGFDVRFVQDRVTELFALKDQEEKLVDESNNLNNQLSEYNHEKTRIEEEVREINEQIRKLKEKLSLVESAKEKHEDLFAPLLARVQVNEENIKNVRCNFEGIVSDILR